MKYVYFDDNIHNDLGFVEIPIKRYDIGDGIKAMLIQDDIIETTTIKIASTKSAIYVLNFITTSPVKMAYSSYSQLVAIRENALVWHSVDLQLEITPQTQFKAILYHIPIDFLDNNIDHEEVVQLHCTYDVIKGKESLQMKGENKIDKLKAKSFLNHLLFHTLKLYKEHNKPKDVIADIAKILGDNSIKNLPTLEQFAEMAKMSTSKLKLKFKKRYGLPIYTYYLNSRMAYAKELIESGQEVHYVAKLIGYSAPIKFIQTFKKYYGETPGKFKLSRINKNK
jgi:AraC-like DNA-binding protein